MDEEVRNRVERQLLCSVVSGQALRRAANPTCLKRQNQPRVKIHPAEEFKK